MTKVNWLLQRSDAVCCTWKDIDLNSKGKQTEHIMQTKCSSDNFSEFNVSHKVCAKEKSRNKNRQTETKKINWNVQKVTKGKERQIKVENKKKKKE